MTSTPVPPMATSDYTPGFKADTRDDFKMAIHVQKSYTSSGDGRPELSTVEVAGEAYPTHKLTFNVGTKTVSVSSSTAVPYMHHLELCNKLSLTLRDEGV